MGIFDKKGVKPFVLILLSLSIIFNAFVGYFLFLDKRIAFTGEEVNMASILVAVFAVMILMFSLSGIFFTNIGQQVIQRFRNRLMYKTGNYVNTLFISKTGVITEMFKKVESDGVFEIRDKKYIRNPKVLYHYKNIPSYIHLEDSPQPIDAFNNSDLLMTCYELDTVMTAETNFDLVKTIIKLLPLVLMGFVIVVGAVALTGFFNYLAYEMLRDGSATVICSNIPTCTGG